jgi:hypothetical protein
MRVNSNRWQDWVVLALGAWLFLSPFVFLPSSNGIDTNAQVVGLAVVLFAGLALVDSRMWEEWINLVLGGWLIVAPFALGFSAEKVPTWNSLIVGTTLGVLSFWLIAVANPSKTAVPRKQSTVGTGGTR